MTAIAHSVVAMFSASLKIALTWATFLVYILPLAACLCLMGVLDQFKGARFYRVPLLPVVAWLAWHGTFVDMPGGDPRLAGMDRMLIVSDSDPVLHATDVAYPTLRYVPWQCGLLCALLLENLFKFGVRVFRSNKVKWIPRASSPSCCCR